MSIDTTSSQSHLISYPEFLRREVSMLAGHWDELVPPNHTTLMGEAMRVQALVRRSLLPVGPERLLPGPPSLMASADLGSLRLLAVAGSDGWLWLSAFGAGGLAPESSATNCLDAAEFEAGKDEPVALFFDPRPLVPHLDIYLAVRRWAPGGKPPVVRLYRAIASAEGGAAHLAPSRDDTVAGTMGWQPLSLSAGELPAWLATSRLSVTHGHRMLSEPPEGLGEWRERVEPGPARLAAWDGERVVWTTAGPELVMESLTGAHASSTAPRQIRIALDIPRPAEALALWSGPGGPMAAVVCPESGIIGVQLCEGGEEVFQQRLRGSATCVALVPGPTGASRPDVVVGRQDGVINYYRPVLDGRLPTYRDAWVGALRRRDNLNDLGDWVTWVSRRCDRGAGGNATEMDHVARLLLRVSTSLPNPRQVQVRALGELLRSGPLSACAVVVGDSVASMLDHWASDSAEGVKVQWRDGDAVASLVPVIAWTIYQSQLYAVQEPIDLAVGGILARGGDQADRARKDAAFNELAVLHKDSHWDLLDKDRDLEVLDRLAIYADFSRNELLLEGQADSTDERYLVIDACPAGDTSVVWSAGSAGPVSAAIPHGGSLTLEPRNLCWPQSSAPHEQQERGVFPSAVLVVPLQQRPPLAIVGQHSNRVMLYAGDKAAVVVLGPADSVCGALALVRSDDASVVLAVAWNEAHRCSIEVVRVVAAADSLAYERILLQPLPLAGVGALEVLSSAKSDEHLVLLAGDPITGDVVELRASPSFVEERARMPVGSGVLSLLVEADGQERRVFAGTRDGLIWCMSWPQGDVVWTFAARRAVMRLRSLDHPDHGRCILALGPPDDLVLVGRDGQRLWRRRHGGPFRDIAVLPGSPDGPRRVVVAGRKRLLVLRMPDRSVDWQARCVEAAGQTSSNSATTLVSPADREAMELARVYGADSPAALEHLLGEIRSRAARIALRERVVLAWDTPSTAPSEAMTGTSFRELWAMLLRLPGARASAWTDAVFDAAVRRIVEEGPGDDSWATRRIALVEAIRRYASTSTDVAQLSARLHRIPATLHSDPWVAVEAGRAWLSCVMRQPGPTPELLAYLDLLPATLGSRISLLARPPELGRALETLAKLAARDSDMPPVNRVPKTVGALTMAERSPLCRALGLLLGVATSESDPTWQELTELVAASEAVAANRQTPLWSVARVCRGLGAIPKNSSPIIQLYSWLRGAATHSLDMGDPSDPHIGPWERFGRWLARAVEPPLRRTIQSKLSAVQRQVRPRLELKSGRWTANNVVELDLLLIPEGFATLHDATVRVRPVGEILRPIGRPLDVTLPARKLYVPGDPPDLVTVEAFCEVDATTVGFDVEFEAADLQLQRAQWTVLLPDRRTLPSTAPSESISLDDLPTILGVMLSSIRRSRMGVMVLAVDDVLGPRTLVQHLARDGETRVIDLDEALRNAGPGRKYPKALDTAGFLRVLNGVAVVHESARAVFDEVEPHGFARVVLFPTGETIERLLHRDLAAAWSALARILHTQSNVGRAPAICLVTSSPHAAALRRRLSDEVSFPRVASVDLAGSSDAVSEVTAWFKDARGCHDRAAIDAIATSGGDLRALGEVAAGGRRSSRGASLVGAELGAALSRWVTVDLRSLAPRELAVLLAIAHARSRLGPDQLFVGMALDDDVTTAPVVARNQPKTIARRGDVLTASRISRLRGLLGKRTFTVRCHGPASTLPEPAAVLLDLTGAWREVARTLSRRGFIDTASDMAWPTARVRGPLDSVVGRSRSLHDAFHELLGVGGLLDGIDLRMLVTCTAATTDLVGLIVPKGWHDVARVAGAIWRNSPDPTDPANSLLKPGPITGFISTLTGETVTSFAPMDTIESAPRPGPSVLNQPSHGSTRRVLTKLGLSKAQAFGVSPLDTVAGFRYFIVVLQHPIHPSRTEWEETLADSARRPGATTKAAAEPPRVIILGPGAEDLNMDDLPDSATALREHHVRSILASPDLTQGFWSEVAAQRGLAAIAPFVPVGALPPGSSMFVGRASILREIESHIRQQSFLILGPRRIGKTSLLHAAHHRLQRLPRVRSVLLSAQGITASSALVEPLRIELRAHGVDIDVEAGAIGLMRALTSSGSTNDVCTVFVINEIDGLLERDRSFFDELRGLMETYGARFVFGGYWYAQEELSKLKSPLFHTTTGDTEGKYFNLATLEDSEALDLIDKLETPPLRLRWEGDDREPGRTELLKLSYGIPWVIQDLCMGLVRVLDRDKRAALRLDDVRREGERVKPVLNHFDALDYSELVGTRENRAINLLARFMLDSLARSLYFSPIPPPIEDPTLTQAASCTWQFTAGDASRVVLMTCTELSSKSDADRLKRWLPTAQVQKLLRGLLLTLILIECGHSATQERAYAFQNHIYPLELKRWFGSGPLTDRLFDTLSDLLGELNGA